jgi:hypothetical protein
MRWRRIGYAALLAALGLAAAAPAERPPEQRGQATHVVLGQVAGVYVRQEAGTRHYLVEIEIDKVEKGEGLRPGGTFYVGCYLWDPDYRKGEKLTEEEQRQLALRGAAYDGVPRPGRRAGLTARTGR